MITLARQTATGALVVTALATPTAVALTHSSDSKAAGSKVQL